MNNEIDWMCYLSVQKGLFSAEQGKALFEICPEETSLMDFAQAVLDNGFTTDVEVLQQVLEETAVNITQGHCPDSVLYPVPAETITAPSPAAPDAPRRKIAFPSSAPAPQQAAPTPLPIPATQQEAPQAIPAPQQSPQAIPAPQQQAAPPASTGGYQHISTSASYPFDVNGFPNLSEAENNPDAAKDLVIKFLQYARAVNASDVHISSASYPHIRRYSINFLIDNQPLLSTKAATAINLALTDELQKEHFKDTQELDYSVDLGGGDRYRTNVMVHNRGIEGSYRVISDKIKSLRELGFENPEIIEKLTTYHQGLILVTGPAGCGKTTTLASLVELINQARKDHIITVEDPVEILIPSGGCNVTQRELHNSTKSFANALRAALREDPDIIIIGEMRDLETIEMAISAAETGHLVIGTLHTSSAGATLDRLLDVFPPSQQPQIRAMLAESLKGIICQRLIPDIHGQKLLMAPEILIGTLAVSNIIKEGTTYQLPSVIETGGKKGMVSAENSVLSLYINGKIGAEQARPFIRTQAKLRQIDLMENSGGAQAYAQQQQDNAEQESDQPKKKGWFK
jgi:twitching motility protein PilT